MKKKLAIGLALGAVAVAGAAYAAQGVADHDPNRTITRAEVQAKAAEMFARMDVNKDGKLDQADRDARRMQMFDRMDANHDGQISRTEFSSFHPMRKSGEGGQAGEHRWGGGQGDHRGGGMRGEHRGGHGIGMMGMARMADANHDGAITQAEFTAAALQRFDRMDANHDGQVTREERQAARSAMREHWRDRMQGAQGGMQDQQDQDAPPAPGE
jgi:Ca2+-binding EF-hand superfamily protein